MPMKPSDSLAGFVEGFEGVRYSAYLDGNGIPTCGIGHTHNVVMGDTCNEAQARAWLLADMQGAADAVNALVKVPLSQNAFDALCSLTFNIGAGHLANSTLLKLLNQNDRTGAANQFLAWNKIAGKESAGLNRRRLAEKAMFLKATA